MTADREDDPLSWGDEGDPTYLDTPRPPSGAPGAQVRPNEPQPQEARSRPRSSTDRAGDRGAGRGTAAGPGDSRGSGDSRGQRDSRAPRDPRGAADAAPAVPTATSSVLLVTLGILAGVYLLYTIGWVLSAQRGVAVPIDALDAVMARMRDWLAVLAPALWFATTLLLTRGRKPVLRVLWLLLGVIALAPIPFIVGT